MAYARTSLRDGPTWRWDLLRAAIETGRLLLRLSKRPSEAVCEKRIGRKF